LSFGRSTSWSVLAPALASARTANGLCASPGNGSVVSPAGLTGPLRSLSNGDIGGSVVLLGVAAGCTRSCIINLPGRSSPQSADIGGPRPLSSASRFQSAISESMVCEYTCSGPPGLTVGLRTGGEGDLRRFLFAEFVSLANARSCGFSFLFRVLPRRDGRYSHESGMRRLMHLVQGWAPSHRSFWRLQDEHARDALLFGFSSVPSS